MFVALWQPGFINNDLMYWKVRLKQKASIQIFCLCSSDAPINEISEIQFTSHFLSEKSFTAPVYVG